MGFEFGVFHEFQRRPGQSEAEAFTTAFDQVDAAELAAKFGGGGHHRAAGIELALPLKDAEAKVLAEVRARMNDLK